MYISKCFAQPIDAIRAQIWKYCGIQFLSVLLLICALIKFATLYITYQSPILLATLTNENTASKDSKLSTAINYCSLSHYPSMLLQKLEKYVFQSTTLRRTYNSKRLFTTKDKIDILGRVTTDHTCFTQGILFLDSSKYIQSCGLYGKSRLQIVDLFSGNILETYFVGNDLFLEGITFYRNSILALTWREGKVLQFRIHRVIDEKPNTNGSSYIFQFDTMKLELEKIHDGYPYEGWGIAADESQSIIYTSDGSSNIHVFSYDDLTHEIDRITVCCSLKNRRHQTWSDNSKNSENNESRNLCLTKKPIGMLNELQFVPPHYLLINVWYSRKILLLNVKSKHCFVITEFVYGPTNLNADVLNGIGLISFLLTVNGTSNISLRQRSSIKNLSQNTYIRDDAYLINDHNHDLNKWSSANCNFLELEKIVGNNTHLNSLYLWPIIFITGKLWDTGYLTVFKGNVTSFQEFVKYRSFHGKFSYNLILISRRHFANGD